MPSYKVGEDIYDIPEEEKKGFLQQFPDAVQIESYVADQDTFDIPIDEVAGFKAAFPNAVAIQIDPKPARPPAADEDQDDEPQQEEQAGEGLKQREADEYGGLAESFGRGVMSLYAGILRTPETIYNLAAWPQNKIGQLTGAEWMQTDGKTFAEYVGLPENKAAEYYENAVEASRKRFNEKYKEGFDQYWKDKDYGKLAGYIGNTLAESLPFMMSMWGAGYANLSRVGTIGGGSLPFIGNEMQESYKENPDLDIATRTEAAFVKGVAETLFEEIGVKSLGKYYAAVAKREGVVAAREFMDKVSNGWAKGFRKYGGASLGEGVSETMTTVTQNYADKYILGKDVDPLDNSVQSFVIGTAGGGLFAGAQAFAEVIPTPKERAKVEPLESRLSQLDKDLADPSLPEPVRAALFEEMESTLEQLGEIQGTQLQKFRSLDPKQQEEFLKLRNETVELRRSLNKLSVDQGKGPLRETMEAEIAKREAKMEELMGGPLIPAPETLDTEVDAEQPTEQPTEEPTEEPVEETADQGLQFDFPDLAEVEDAPQDFNLINSVSGEQMTITDTPQNINRELQSEREKLTKLKDCL